MGNTAFSFFICFLSVIALSIESLNWTREGERRRGRGRGRGRGEEVAEAERFFCEHTERFLVGADDFAGEF